MHSTPKRPNCKPARQESIIEQYTQLWIHMLESNDSTELGAAKLVESISQNLMDEYFKRKGLDVDDTESIPEEIEAPPLENGVSLEEYYAEQARLKFGHTYYPDACSIMNGTKCGNPTR